MRKTLVLIIVCVLPMVSMAADVAKYCMTYADYVADRWTPVDSLLQGRTLQLCQLEYKSNGYKIKTGDKEADKILKEQVFAVCYGKWIFVNCRNMRYNGSPLDTKNYIRAFRYNGNMLGMAIVRSNTATILTEMCLDVTSYFVPLGVSIALGISSWTLDLTSANLRKCRCFFIDRDSDPNGCYSVTYMNDEYIQCLLVDDFHLLERYMTISKKKRRQSAANVLPVLISKGLIEYQ